MSEFITLLQTIQIGDVIDIIIVGALFFGLFALLRETRSSVALRGLIGILLLSFVFFFVAKVFSLVALTLIFERFWVIVILVFLIVFQNEFKKALTEIGQIKFFRRFFTGSAEFLDEVIRAVEIFSERKIGALIVFERKNPLKVYSDTGIKIDSLVTSELLRTIFATNTPLHDGAIIIRDDRIIAAGCILPLTNDPNISKDLGTRHRAAIGLSEETDAVVIVVSEETGIISIAEHGGLTRRVVPDKLKENLIDYLGLKREVVSND